MVQIPQYVQQVGLDAPSRSIPNVIAPSDGGIGNALQNLGGTITNVAEHIQARNDQKAAFDAKVGYDTFTEKVGQAQVEAERNAPADGTGLHDNLLTTRSKLAGEFLGTITNPELRAKYQTILNTSDAEHWSNEGANAEWKIGNKYSTDQVNTMWTKRGQGIAANPASVKSYVDDMVATVDKAPNLTPAQREEIKQNIREQGPKIAVEALKDQDPEALYYATGHGTDEQRIGFLTKRAVAALPGVDSTKIQAAIKKNGGDVAGALGELADETGVKEQDKAAFIEKGLTGMGTARLVSGKAGVVHKSGDGGSATGLISSFEGLRLKPYWDVNHYRVGFGSDTVTLADGTVQKVTKDTRITAEDAMRDLNRRKNETQAQVASQIGPGWDSLPEGAKAALTSVAYNYGTLPKSVAAAASSGDPNAVSKAILGLSSDNGGVNAKRRAREARVAAGEEAPHGGNVQIADASGTGGLSANDAGPQYADGVPGEAAPPRSGFISSALSDLPASDFLDAQHTGASAYAKSAQAQLAQDTADKILATVGATDKGAGDSAAAYKMLDSISDASVRKDVATLIDSHFTRWTRVEADQAKQNYAKAYADVNTAMANNDAAGAMALVTKSNLPPNEQEQLKARIAKGPVPFDDPAAEHELTAQLLKDPTAFANIDLIKHYGNKLTDATLQSFGAKQDTINNKVEADASKGKADAKAWQASLIATGKTANPIIEDNLKAIGINDSGANAKPADIQHANLVRSMTMKEIEKLQTKLGREPSLSEIQDTVDAVMKTYPRFKPVEASTLGSLTGGWLGRAADTDVSMPEVLKSFDDAKQDPQMAADALRKAGKPVNPATLQQALDDYLAVHK
ncbi:hypothetical protein UFOVP143_3 [uncultured Caudovirales phage]|uniref:Lysozyme n=1 Tax=uncultured Caudovirales phage TaxID=2100421 RepID=A0A6J7VKS1_9CAUD|nr:hypothetical protein UFOVP143_3 [uncultured Caudovirales phage]